MVKNNIGIMQGRLSPPTEGKFQSFPKSTWRDEFFAAKEAGLKIIEWIFEADEWENNPISSDHGISEIKSIKNETGIAISSICADYFMEIPYFTSDQSNRSILRDKLDWLILQASKINVAYIDLPFVDASKIDNQKQYELVSEFIKSASKIAGEKNVIIALETNLGPEEFKTLLSYINHKNVYANYDTGNSSGIGYNCSEELKLYGKSIKTLHIKDRLLGNGTKPLGHGSADFDLFFSELSLLNFNGPIILQAARETEGEETKTAVKNRLFVENYLEKYNIK